MRAGVIDIDISGLLTLGDLIVGIGTGALAFFTWRLAKATYRLDEDTAERERQARDRRVRGIARLVDGELETTRRSFRAVIDHSQWQIGSPTPRAAWDRDGAVLVEAVTEEQALALIALFADLHTWANLERDARVLGTGTTKIGIKPGTPMRTRVDKLLAQIDAARTELHPLAYPEQTAHTREAVALLATPNP